jgi:hypothetical protein
MFTSLTRDIDSVHATIRVIKSGTISFEASVDWSATFGDLTTSGFNPLHIGAYGEEIVPIKVFETSIREIIEIKRDTPPTVNMFLSSIRNPDTVVFDVRANLARLNGFLIPYLKHGRTDPYRFASEILEGCRLADIDGEGRIEWFIGVEGYTYALGEAGLVGRGSFSFLVGRASAGSVDDEPARKGCLTLSVRRAGRHCES